MIQFRHRLFAMLGVSVALVALTGGPTAVAGAELADETRARSASAAGSISAARSPSACSDRAFNVYGGRWHSTLHWSYRASSTPGYLGQAAVVDVLKRSFANITGARNDCGRADNVSATSAYDGIASRKPSVGSMGRCTRPDGFNVVGFGDLPFGVLAVTCTRFQNGRIIETDVRINTRFHWALSQANCSGAELLEPTMTHELGHSYGLAHVGERRHGRLTMSTTSDGSCSNAESTLGLGDMLALEQLY
jgi:hypothetical protein